MNKLTPKTSGFLPGRKVFFFADGSHLIMTEEPQEFISGVEVPSEVGDYFVRISTGAFVIKVSDSGVRVTTLWETSTGSYADGVMHVNSTDMVFSETPTVTDSTVFSDLAMEVEYGATTIVDFGEFSVVGLMREGSSLGFLKFDSEFANPPVKIYYPGNANDIGIWYVPAISKEIGGAIIINYALDELVYFDFYEETVTNLSATELDPGRDGAIVIEGGVIIVDGDNYCSVYQFEEDKTITHIGNFPWLVDGRANLLPWNQYTYSVYADADTIYLTDSASVRAIDRNTYDLLWSKSLNYFSGALVRAGMQGGTILHDGNFAHVYRDTVYIEEPLGPLGYGGYESYILVYDRDTGDETVKTLPHGILYRYPQAFIVPSDPGKLYVLDDYSYIIRFDLETLDFEVVLIDETFNLLNYEMIPFSDANNNVYAIRSDNPIMVVTPHGVSLIGEDVEWFPDPQPCLSGNSLYYFKDTNHLTIGKSTVS